MSTSRTLTRNLHQVKSDTIFVGVDLALDQNVAVVLTENARRVGRFEFPNTRDGYDYFYQRIDSLLEKFHASEAMVGMEPTNYFWTLLASDIERRGSRYSYRLVNPYAVKRAREAYQLARSKDDRRDALTIADLMRTGKYTKTRLLKGAYAELRQQAVLYAQLRKELVHQKNLIRNLAGQMFPELTQVFVGFYGQTIVAMMRCCASASVIREISFTDFVAMVRSEFRGKRLMTSKLEKAYRLSSTSVGITEGTSALQQSLRMHIQVLDLLQQQLEQAQTTLIETFSTLPEAKYMLSIPYLGDLSSAIILAEIGDPSNFANGYQLVKLAGIQPVPNTSGRKTRSKTPMSHKGRPLLREFLFSAVLRLIQKDKAFSTLYHHLLNREKNPLAKMEAIGALMNKLVTLLWGLITHQRLYDPDRWLADLKLL